MTSSRSFGALVSVLLLGLTSVPGVLRAQSAIFSDGFEDGTFDAWSSVRGEASPGLVSITPSGAFTSETSSVAIRGILAGFEEGVTEVDFGEGIRTGTVLVIDSNHLSVRVTVAETASPGARDVVVTTGERRLEASKAFEVSIPPTPSIRDFTPKTASVGSSVTVTGTDLAPGGRAPRVILSDGAGGTIDAPVTAFASDRLDVVVPPGAGTGTLTVTAFGKSGASGDELSIVASSGFSLTGEPSTATTFSGETAAFALTLESTDGFAQLADLAPDGLPEGLEASLTPSRLAAGQTALLEIAVPASQVPASMRFTATAVAVVDGLTVSSTTSLTLEVTSTTTAFAGRTVVDDAIRTPIAGVTVSMLGKNDQGQATACSGQAVSDEAGNFLVSNLPAGCAGRQLVRFDGLTVTSPEGTYAGVDLAFDLVADELTRSPLLIHLPRIDNAETVRVIQGHSEDQVFTFDTIPDLKAIVYAGTTLTLPDGTRPDPFPFTAIQVPVDRLPDEMPDSTQSVAAFIVAFQPANTLADQPVAVSFPNTLGTPPGTAVQLSTLDPNRGSMVIYGTGRISNDGRQIVPDFDPVFPDRRFGIIHFDWHGPAVQPAPDVNPSVDPDAPTDGGSVDLATGLEVFSQIDLTLPGSRGKILFTRTYRNRNNRAGPFGIGTGHGFSHRLDTRTPQNAAIVNLVLPTGAPIPMSRQADGTLINTDVPSLRGAVLRTRPDGRSELRWPDGTVLRFIPSSFALGSVLDEVVDRNANTISLRRADANPALVTEIVDPVGRKLSLSYDGAGRVTSVTDPIGRAVVYTYGRAGRLETVTDPAGGVTRYEYNAQAHLSRVIDPRGVVSFQNTYDATGRVIEQRQADGGVLRFEYSLINPLVPTSPVAQTVVTDPLGRRTTYRFNPQGYVTSVIDPAGQDRIFERQPGTNDLLALRGSGQCTICGDPRRGDVSFTYDERGNVRTVTDALGASETYTYLSNFDVVETATDAMGNVVTFTYDERGNPTSVTDGDGVAASFEYDVFGQVIGKTDAAGAVTRYEHDAQGNPIRIIDPFGNELTMIYDGVSRLLEVADALGHSFSVGYDEKDRVTETRRPGGVATRFTYDAIGRLLSATDARGNAARFEYDAAGRLTKRNDLLGASETQTWDLAGNLVEFVDRRGLVSRFTYDVLDRKTAADYAGDTVEILYDKTGRPIRVVDSTSGTFTYRYDAAGGLVFSATPVGVVTYERNPLQLTASRQVAGHSRVDYSYNAAGLMTQAASPEASVDLAYDHHGRASTIRRSNGVTTTVTRDAMGRQLSSIHRRGSEEILRQVYGYDAGGNRTRLFTDHGDPLAAAAAIGEYNAANQVVRFRDRTYTYDAAGNRLTETSPEGTLRYGWDARDRLRTIETPSGAIYTFFYDHGGSLIRYDASEDGVERTEKFVRDDITNVVAHISSDRRETGFLTGRDVDTPFASVSASQVRFTLQDVLRSVVGLTDSGGALVDAASYGPFGRTEDPIDFRFEFTARLRILDDLYYYRARHYDVFTGRFLTEDPLGLPGAVNLYFYADGDPLSLIDPLGLKPIDDFQTFLDFLGLVPGFGEPVDGINALIYSARGQWGNAALSAAAMVPVFGSIGTGGKILNKSKRFTPDQSALVDLAKQVKRKGVTPEEGRILKEWGKEVDIPVKGPEVHPNRNFNVPHYHVGPVDHIPVRKQ